MVQWGAYGKARRGLSASDILAYYYGGLRPEDHPEPGHDPRPGRERSHGAPDRAVPSRARRSEGRSARHRRRRDLGRRAPRGVETESRAELPADVQADHGSRRERPDLDQIAELVREPQSEARPTIRRRLPPADEGIVDPPGVADLADQRRALLPDPEDAGSRLRGARCWSRPRSRSGPGLRCAPRRGRRRRPPPRPADGAPTRLSASATEGASTSRVPLGSGSGSSNGLATSSSPRYVALSLRRSPSTRCGVVPFRLLEHRTGRATPVSYGHASHHAGAPANARLRSASWRSHSTSSLALRVGPDRLSDAAEAPTRWGLLRDELTPRGDDPSGVLPDLRHVGEPHTVGVAPELSTE